MSLSYDPGLEALLDNRANVTFLSQRDLALTVPINFVTAPSVSVTAACFANNRYEAGATAKCLSNILSVNFKTVVIDLYWDQNALSWSLCPVELPLPAAVSQTTITSAPASTATSSAPISVLSERRAIFTSPPSADTHEARYERDASPAEPQTDATSIIPTNVTHAVPESLPGERLFNVGPYTCSPAANITLLLVVLTGYLHATDYTLAANFKQIIFNLHSASPVADPTGPPVQIPDSKLPTSANLIGSIFKANLSSYIYTPTSLSEQRANLNTSWNEAPAQDAPDLAYFANLTQQNSISTSSDGWPSEGFLEFYRQSRLVLGFGTVDPQLAHYDFQEDSQSVFAPGYLSRRGVATFASNGSVVGGCIFDQRTWSIASVNSSWAYVTIDDRTASFSQDDDPSATLEAAHSLTDCGMSPHLNTTIANVTADTNATPYLDFTLATVWSWAPGQPLDDSYADNATFPRTDDDHEPATDFRCAYFNASASSSALYSPNDTGQPSTSGRWAVTFCQNRLPAACRDNHHPYLWSISSTRGRYSDVNDDCPPNSSFAVPRTALENRYLLAAARDHFSSSSESSSSSSGRRDSDDDGTAPLVWLNFNSLNFESCWVAGVNSTCPYSTTAGQTDGQVVVPTVAAFAIIVLAVLTILAKCGANRRTSRKRRRVRDGWEYEGVPS